ncbi:hypothetical protein HMPREF1141_1445 [Clostridium sp. MSTE9]|nr:hypothetical protein HMPREF1141_1445 [Clostridium sp. MSTE9]
MPRENFIPRKIDNVTKCIIACSKRIFNSDLKKVIPPKSALLDCTENLFRIRL